VCAPDTLCHEVGITSHVGSHQGCRKPIMRARHVSLPRTQCAAGASHHVQHSVPRNTPAIAHVHGVYDDAGATMRPARIACLTVFCAILMMGAASGDTAAARPDPDTSEKKGKPVKNPTRRPTKRPTRRPTKTPTKRPTKAPTPAPTAAPVTDLLVQGQSAFETSRPRAPTQLAPTSAGPYAIAHRGSCGVVQQFAVEHLKQSICRSVYEAAQAGVSTIARIPVSYPCSLISSMRNP